MTDILKVTDVTFIEPIEKSTSSGLKEFFSYIPDNTPFIFTWSDLLFTTNINIQLDSPITIGLTNDFECRWSVDNKIMVKKSSSINGIAGVFFVKGKEYLNNIDSDKSFVGTNLLKYPTEIFSYKTIDGLTEIGTYEKYTSMLAKEPKNRFFNDVTILENTVIKKCIDPFYNNLIDNEINWYKVLNGKVNFIPKLLTESPLTMTRITGKHIFDKSWDIIEESKIMISIISNLNNIHSLETISSKYEDMSEIYLNKTFSRVNQIKSIIPHFNDLTININGKICLNPFHEMNLNTFKDSIKDLYVPNYNIIHGDTTFSNILIDDDLNTFLIDPRGIFGNTKIYGDKAYDWAKLFYSVNGNYDSINSKNFHVKIDSNAVKLTIKSNNFERFSHMVIEASGLTKSKMLLHQTLIWLSLTGYVKEDIDSILYSFYYGIYLWNLSLN